MALAICFHLIFGKSPRKWCGAVGTPCRSTLWNQSPNSEIRCARWPPLSEVTACEGGLGLKGTSTDSGTKDDMSSPNRAQLRDAGLKRSVAYPSARALATPFACQSVIVSLCNHLQ